MKRLAPEHVLTRLVEASRERLDRMRTRVPDSVVRKMAAVAGPVPSFKAVLSSGAGVIIAEIKQASPSAGVLRSDLDPAGLAALYGNAGARAISVVTEERFFQGSLAWVGQAARASGLPVLRKDFLFAPYQIAETRAAGASAVLLIVAILEPDELSLLLGLAGEYGMDALVEVHDERELDEALGAGAGIIGVNNRDLKTFKVDLETSFRLGERIPEGVLFVAESGLRDRADVERLRDAGADGFLIGETLLRSGDPAEALKALL